MMKLFHWDNAANVYDTEHDTSCETCDALADAREAEDEARREAEDEARREAEDEA